jgi:hypothetical protein
VRVRNVDSNISGAGESDGIRVREDASAATEVLSQKYIGLAPPVSSRGSIPLANLVWCSERPKKNVTSLFLLSRHVTFAAAVKAVGRRVWVSSRKRIRFSKVTSEEKSLPGNWSHN